MSEVTDAGVRPGTAHFAFPIFDAVPNRYRLHPIKDGRNEPHFRVGEWAVIDPDDRYYVSGEVYLIRCLGEHGTMLLGQIQTRPYRDVAGNPCIFLDPINRPRDAAKLDEWFGRRRIHMSEGPFSPKQLDEVIQGRVVGVFGVA